VTELGPPSPETDDAAIVPDNKSAPAATPEESDATPVPGAEDSPRGQETSKAVPADVLSQSETSEPRTDDAAATSPPAKAAADSGQREAAPSASEQGEKSQADAPPPPAPVPAPQPEATAAATAAAAQAEIAARAIAEQTSASLATLERVLLAQQDRQLALFRETNRMITLLGVGIAVVGLLALGLAAWFQSRSITVLREVAARSREIAPSGRADAWLPPAAEDNVPGMERIEASGKRFQGMMTTLERRLEELEDLAARTPSAAHQDERATETSADIAATDAAGTEEPSVSAAARLARAVPHAGILLRKAETLIQMGRADEALAVLDEAEAAEADGVDLHLLRGQAFEKLGRPEDALAAYEQAEKLDATNPSALLMKAGVLNRQERFDEALKCYEKALQLQRAEA